LRKADERDAAKSNVVVLVAVLVVAVAAGLFALALVDKSARIVGPYVRWSD
jgi:hypothetical protein